jgi:hypothetical protein
MGIRIVAALLLFAVALMGQGCAGFPLPFGQQAEPPGGTASAPGSTGSAAAPPSPAASSGSASPPASPAAVRPASQGATAPTAVQPRQKAPASVTSIVVKPRIDQEKAQTSLISASAGGKIEASAPNGVTYTLEIPKDSLLTDELITVTPVSQIDGLPLSGGLLGAVDLKPDGVRFVRPVVLTIKLPSGFNNADLIGFAYQGAGEGLHLYPVSGDGSAITAHLMHFSSYGAGEGTGDDSQYLLGPDEPAKNLTEAEARFESEVATAYEKARRTNKSVDEGKELEDALRAFFDAQVWPNLKSAETNDQLLDSALSQYLSWLKQAELAGLREVFGPERERADASAKKGLRNAFDKASQRCVQDIDYEQGYRMLTRARQAGLLYGIEYEDLNDKLDKCWRFRLDYESIVKWEIPTPQNFTAHVKSQVTLKMRPDMTAFDGEAPLEYVEYSMEWMGDASIMNALCQVDLKSTDTTLTVSPLVSGLNVSEKGTPPRMLAVLDPGSTTETWGLKCDTGAGTIQTLIPFPALGWSSGFSQVHKDQSYYPSTVNGVPEGSRKYIFNHFQPAGKPVVGRETGTREATVEGARVTDEYTIDIIHMPKGGATDTSGSSDQSGSSEPARKPVGPKTTDASALPPELKPIPGPPDFDVVEGSTTRMAPGGTFQFAQASWWGTGSIQQTVGFYNQALAGDWIPGDEMMGQSDFRMEFVSKTDSNRTLQLDGEVDKGGITVRQTIQQK